MRTRQLLLAIAGVCASTAAFAQSANPVTLYGRIYAVAETVRATGGVTPVSTRNRVTDRVSLIGIRGAEDLGVASRHFSNSNRRRLLTWVGEHSVPATAVSD